jgi:hypothetical protein
MRQKQWDPVSYIENFSKLPDCPATHRAYQSAKYFLTASEQKRLREYEVAMSFCSRLGITASLVMLEPASSNPPPPDIECRLSDGSHFLELGEVIQEDIIEASEFNRKYQTLDATEPKEPLSKVWPTLWRIFTKKLGKRYHPDNRPISLLLYYDQADSYWELLRPVFEHKAIDFRNSLLDSGTFDQVFLFDMKRGEILRAIETESLRVQS